MTGTAVLIFALCLGVAVCGLVGFGYQAWQWRERTIRLEGELRQADQAIAHMAAERDRMESERDELLRQKKAAPARKDAAETPAAGRRYVSIAARRAAAEAASLGPQTHKDQVRENNARAMEGA